MKILVVILTLVISNRLFKLLHANMYTNVSLPTFIDEHVLHGTPEALYVNETTTSLYQFLH